MKLKFLLISLIIILPKIAFLQETLAPNASFLGTHNYERVGYHLHTAGDINNDGYDDFLIGTFHNESHGYNSGAAYLILGKANIDYGFGRSLSNANARFVGEKAYDAVGYYLGGGGDINGDGFDDIIIGAPAGDESVMENPGHVYMVFGKSNVDWGYNYILPQNADVNFSGEGQQDLAGVSVAILGDINGDGYDDIICGAPYNDYNATDGGKAYIILGKPDGWSRNINFNQADASFYGSVYSGLVGYSVDGLGDVNGDGILDFAIGARGEDKVYLFFGRQNVDWGKNFDVRNADVVLEGENAGDWAGWRVSKAGDVNGDGFNDILVGAPFYTSWYDYGKGYLIFGRNSLNWPTQLSNADASFVGEGANDQACWDIQNAGDVNGDGYDDFVIGAWYNDSNGTDSGKLYLIYGKESGWQRDVNLSGISPCFVGEHAGDFAGFSVACAGDMNADGLDDLVASETYNSEACLYAGKILLFISENNNEAELSVAPTSLEFTDNELTKTFSITNSGGKLLNWEAFENPDETWLNPPQPLKGNTIVGKSEVVTVQVDGSNLSDGEYNGKITVTSNGG